MVRKNFWVFGLCLMLAGLVGMVGTARLSADVSISDREAGQVWGGQYCTPSFSAVNGCGDNGCPVYSSYNPTGPVYCSAYSPSYCVSCNAACGNKNLLLLCVQPPPPPQ